MDGQASAEEFPTLYRTILDAVAELERLGERGEAARVRNDAIAVYSTAWDARGRRKLGALIQRANRVVAGTDRPRANRPHSAAGRRAALDRLTSAR